MATATARAELRALAQMVAKLEAGRKESPLLDRLRADPADIFRAAKMTPDAWQQRLLSCRSSRLLLLCSRQSGKSQTAAALALREALLKPPALVLLLSPTQRQSGELFKDKVRRLCRSGSWREPYKPCWARGGCKCPPRCRWPPSWHGR